MKKIKNIIYKLKKIFIYVLSLFLFGVGVILIWFLVVGFSSSEIWIPIGIAAISAFFAMVSSIANLIQADEIKKQRESLDRPYILAYFDPVSSGGIYFTLENFGNSPACDVTVQFNPPPIDFANRPLNEISLFKNPISFIPPGKKIQQIIGMGHTVLAEGKQTVFNISLSYTSVHNQTFKEELDSDISYLKDATVPIKSVEDHLIKISTTLEDLVNFIKTN